MPDSSADEQDSAEWVFYRDRSEWKDVTPLEQDDGPYPIVRIAYSDKFQDVHNYFRAVLKKKEKSERAFQLTKDVVNLNAANYTVWQYRRQLLFYLGKDLYEELRFIKEAIEEYPKNYQVWHHLMFVVKCLNDPSNELRFINDMLIQDSKNYHAWQYRQWILSTFKLFDGELDYIDSLLKKDVRNNSAWNHRYFVLNHTTDFSEEAIQADVDYTVKAIEKSKQNESAWNYLRGILFHSEKGLLEPQVMSFCEELYKCGEKSPHLLSYILDAYVEAADADKQKSAEWLQKGEKLCEELVEHDRIRASYWKYITSTLKEKSRIQLSSS